LRLLDLLAAAVADEHRFPSQFRLLDGFETSV
jgi:hypothetical protein